MARTPRSGRRAAGAAAGVLLLTGLAIGGCGVRVEQHSSSSATAPPISSSPTSQDTSPYRSAVAASMIPPSISSSVARPSPTTRGSR